MSERININVSTVDYGKTGAAIGKTLSLLEDRTHGENEFVMTDSEFAFGWHFFVLSVNRSMVEQLAELIGPEFERYKGKTLEKKFLSWLASQIEAGSPRFKLAIKEEMESSKYGLF